jgi:hypothetical protein
MTVRWPLVKSGSWLEIQVIGIDEGSACQPMDRGSRRFVSDATCIKCFLQVFPIMQLRETMTY